MSDPSSSRTVRVIGRYALHDEIASGGMATVHLGRLLGTGGFSRTVAIKRLHVHLAKDPAFVAMLLDEARIVARIRHLNVVPTLDVVSADDELFLVMEYVQGESLAKLLRTAQTGGKRLPIAVVVSILVGVLHGLHAAHEAKNEHGESLQIVHRDVSPQNVLVGVDGVARVLDFGVAKATGRIQSTREGQLKGKLAYMAPEQIQGSPSRLSDIYAASVVLWEALAGQRLVTGENEASVLAQALRGTIEPPSVHAKDVSDELSAIVLRGLARDPTERFPTAREMARALERTGPLAPASEVGELVEALAAQSLALRSGQLAEIESNSSVNVRALMPVVVSTPPTGTQVPSQPKPALVEPIHSPRAEPEPPPPPRRSSLLVGILASSALLLGAVSIWLATRGSAAPSPQPDTSTAAASASATEDAPSAAASAIPAPLASVAADPIAAPSSAAAPPLPPPATPAKRPPAAAPRGRCNPPYTVDAAGDKHYKRECLK